MGKIVVERSENEHPFFGAGNRDIQSTLAFSGVQKQAEISVFPTICRSQNDNVALVALDAFDAAHKKRRVRFLFVLANRFFVRGTESRIKVVGDSAF